MSPPAARSAASTSSAPEDRRRLGFALGARADESLELIEESAPWSAAPAGGDPGFQDRRRQTRRLATLLIARWLVTGELASEEEARWIGQLGHTAGRQGVSMALMTMSYLSWADSVNRILVEEAAAARVAPAVLREALAMVTRSCNTSLVRMADAYDTEIARLVRQTREQARRFGALHEVATAASGVLEPSDLARTAIEKVSRLLGARGAALLLWDRERGVLEPLAKVGHAARVFEAPIRSGEGATGLAFETRRPVTVEQYRTWDRALRSAPGRLPASVVAVPLLVGDAAIGALGASFSTPRHLGQDPVRMLTLLAAQVAPAIVAALAHRDLALSEEQLRLVYQTMPCGILVRDSSGLVLDANPAAARILGIPLARLRGHRAPFSMAGEPGRDLATDADGGGPTSLLRPAKGVLIRAAGPGGEPLWLQVDAIPIRTSPGDGRRMITAFVDVTAVKQAEEAGRESEAKSQFMAAMSHELRTPLNSILGFAQLLQLGNPGPLNERQGRYVSHIRTSGEHLLALINDVLDLSKVAAGEMTIALARVEVGPLLVEVLRSLEPMADAKGLGLGSDLDPDLEVEADRRRLQQILLNLLSNAIKFTERGSIEVSCVRAGEGVRLVVKDTGIGIPADQVESVFNEFAQVTRETAFREGTGLGLPLSRRLAELMGGRLWLESVQGRGTDAILVLRSGG